MKIIIVSDAWLPQVNGVVRTYENTVKELIAIGHQVLVIGPDRFSTIPCPGYKSIRLSLWPGKRLPRLIEEFGPDTIHIATEGPLGHAARSYCISHSLDFTSSFHTQFPEYVRLRIPVPIKWSYACLRRYHARARRTLVPTQSQKNCLLERGFNNIEVWGRGVDTAIFRPGADIFADLPKPVFLNAGRVAVEKNIEAFLDMELPGSKVVVGDGPDLVMLKQKYPDVLFPGFRFGEDLANHIASADVFVFPSLTDTFGIVLLEAMACGVPVAAYPVTGPIDVVKNGVSGILDMDLHKAALDALALDPDDCIAYARAHTWQACTRTFLKHLVPVNRSVQAVAVNTLNGLIR